VRGFGSRPVTAVLVAGTRSFGRGKVRPDYPYWTMAPRFGLDVGEAYLRWCDETVEEVCPLKRVEEGSKR
jgi:hypothetical protein